MGRATTPAHDTLHADGDDWLGSSTQLGASESSSPPSHATPAFRQGLHSVQELSEDAAPPTGQDCLAEILLYTVDVHNLDL